MGAPELDENEREIIRNLELIGRARRCLNKGLLKEVRSRWYRAIWDYSAKRSLDVSVDEDSNCEVTELSESADAAELIAERQADSDFPGLDACEMPNIEWSGMAPDGCIVPRLSIRGRDYWQRDVLDLFGGRRGVRVALDYTPISAEQAESARLRKRSEARRFVEDNSLKPGNAPSVTWTESEGSQGQQVFRYDTRWEFACEPEKVEVDLIALMSEQRKSLEEICPMLAYILDEYAQLCARFGAALKANKKRLRSPKATGDRKSSQCPFQDDLPQRKMKYDAETSFVRAHLDAVLHAEWLYSANFNSDEDGDTTLEKRIPARLLDLVSRQIEKEAQRIAEQEGGYRGISVDDYGCSLGKPQQMSLRIKADSFEAGV